MVGMEGKFMDRRTLLAMTLCFLIFLGWQKLFPQYYPNQATHSSAQSLQVAQSQSTPSQASTQTNNTQSSQTASSGSTGAAQTIQKISGQSSQATAPQSIQVATSIGEASIGDAQSFFTGWRLKGYKQGISEDAATVDMQSVTHQQGEVQLAFDDPQYSYLNRVQGTLSKPAGANAPYLWTYEDQNVRLTREFAVSNDAPYIDVRVTADFKSSQIPKYAFISLSAHDVVDDQEAHDRQIVYWSNQSLERITLKDSEKLQEVSTPVKYMGATNRYFIFTTVAQSPMEARGLIQPLGQGRTAANLVYPVSGKSISIPFRAYFGPKEIEVLKQVEPTLDHTIDFGWFTVFAYPLLKVLKWLYQYLHNYGLAIICLTLLLKIVTYPLTYKSMKSMKKMAALQPQLQKIRERYKDDREALNREMLTMMKSHGYNPMAGCLPMIIQMPIFFALYRVLYSSIELYHAPFFLWIHDLSSRDPFYVTPVLLSLTMFVQQKLTPNTATDPAQAKMMQLMPLIFGAFMLTLPSGLTVYMLVNAIASIAQQMILNKKLNVAPAK